MIATPTPATMLGAVEIEEAETPDDSKLRRIATFAEKAKTLRAEITKKQTELEDLEKQLRVVEENDLPAAMQEVGLKDFTLSDGSSIELQTKIYASIPKERTEEACDWLREHEYGDIIKRVVSIPFGRGEDTKAEALMKYLKKTFKDHNPTDISSVHSSTLASFVKELEEAGEELPPSDLFGIFKRHFAKIKPPKQPTKARKK